MIGPVIGGLALTKMGAAWCFGLNGLSFVAVIIALMRLHVRYVPERTDESMLGSMKQGFGFIHGQAAMVSLIVLAFCMTVLGIPLIVFLPVFVKDVFHQGPSVYTLFLSISGAGSVLGALVVAGLGNVRAKGRVALIMLLLLGVCMAGFSLSKSLVASCVRVVRWQGGVASAQRAAPSGEHAAEEIVGSARMRFLSAGTATRHTHLRKKSQMTNSKSQIILNFQTLGILCLPFGIYLELDA